MRLAWAYVALRVVHSLVQVTWNKIEVRFAVFGAVTGMAIAVVFLLPTQHAPTIYAAAFVLGAVGGVIGGGVGWLMRPPVDLGSAALRAVNSPSSSAAGVPRRTSPRVGGWRDRIARRLRESGRTPAAPPCSKRRWPKHRP